MNDIKYEMIEKANAEIKCIPIGDKFYATVDERIRAFRKVFPTGFIKTITEYDIDGVCKMRAECGYYADDGTPRVLGTGTAQEKQNASYINKKSYIENCETSCTGRALGNAGFIGASADAFCSAEEMQNATAPTEEPKQKTAKAAEPKKTEPKKKTEFCSECNKVIIDTTSNGKTYTAQKIAEESRNNYGRTLCFSCSVKAKKGELNV